MIRSPQKLDTPTKKKNIHLITFDSGNESIKSHSSFEVSKVSNPIEHIESKGELKLPRESDLSGLVSKSAASSAVSRSRSQSVLEDAINFGKENPFAKAPDMSPSKIKDK